MLGFTFGSIVTLFTVSCVVLSVIYFIRQSAIDSFKIGYYETTLRIHGINIDEIKNISFREVMKG